jgi:hypothetical protein
MTDGGKAHVEKYSTIYIECDKFSSCTNQISSWKKIKG